MPRPKGGIPTGGPRRYSYEQLIIHRQEKLAIRLLDRALNKQPNPNDPPLENEPPIDIQLDVFERVGKWVGIKNKIDQQGEETQLDSFKRRINAESTVDQKRAYKPDTGGTALRRLQSKLPNASPRSDDGDRDDTVGEDPVAA